MKGRLYICCACLVLALMAPGVAAGEVDESAETSETLDLFDDDTEETRLGWQQFHMSVGVTYLDADGSFSALTQGGDLIPIIDFERAGIRDTDSSYWVSMNWRSARSRWGGWFGSWRYDVSGSSEWRGPENVDFPPVGVRIDSDFDATWYILEATYSFFRSDTVDTGIGFGIHAVDLETTLTGRFEVGDQGVEFFRQEIETLAPLPNILGYLHWKLSPRWTMVGRLGWFGLDYDKYSGGMTNAHAMFNYTLSERWGIGLGYQFVDLDLDVEKDKYTQVYDIEFSGPIAFLRLAF